MDEGLNKAFGVPAVFENKPGASGAIAAEVAANAKPDGQTIFVCSNTAAASDLALMKPLPYDPLKDFAPVTSRPQVKAATVRCLGVGSRGRYKLTPDIPSLNEQGIPDFELMTWTGILMPRGVPQPVMAKLREAMLKAITDPAYVERQAQGG